MAASSVSIVVPTHNRVELLARALESVWAQTHPEVELVVVDDGSTDATPARLREWQAAGRIQVLIRHERPRGPCAARNAGLRAAQGRYVGLLDDDDAYHPERVRRLLAVLQAHPEYAFVCSDYLSIRSKGTRRSRKPGRITLEKMLWMNYAGQSILAQRDKVLAVGGFDESLHAAQDYDLFTRMIIALGPAYRLGEVLYYYHQEHEAARISTNPRKRFGGYYAYYLKHRSRMSRAQRAWHLYRLLKLRGRRIGPSRFLAMVPPRFYALELNDFFIHHTPLYRWLNRFVRPTLP